MLPFQWRLCNWDGLLTQPCGQEDGQCDYAELVDVPYMTPSVSRMPSQLPHLQPTGEDDMNLISTSDVLWTD